MKKILGIMVLGLLWCNSAYAEEILIKCSVEGSELNFIVDTKKKTWGTTSENKPQAAVITDKFFLRTWYYSAKKKKIATTCFSNGMCDLGYREINRLSGEYTEMHLKVPKEKIVEFNNKNSFRSVEKLRIAMKRFMLLNPGTVELFASGNCKKSEKAF